MLRLRKLSRDCCFEIPPYPNDEVSYRNILLKFILTRAKTPRNNAPSIHRRVPSQWKVHQYHHIEFPSRQVQANITTFCNPTMPKLAFTSLRLQKIRRICYEKDSFNRVTTIGPFIATPARFREQQNSNGRRTTTLA